jgi:hypothetical protein
VSNTQEAAARRARLLGSVRRQFSHWAERLDDDQLAWLAGNLGDVLAHGVLDTAPVGGGVPRRDQGKSELLYIISIIGVTDETGETR